MLKWVNNVTVSIHAYIFKDINNHSKNLDFCKLAKAHAVGSLPIHPEKQILPQIATYWKRSKQEIEVIYCQPI